MQCCSAAFGSGLVPPPPARHASAAARLLASASSAAAMASCGRQLPAAAGKGGAERWGEGGVNNKHRPAPPPPPPLPPRPRRPGRGIQCSVLICRYLNTPIRTSSVAVAGFAKQAVCTVSVERAARIEIKWPIKMRLCAPSLFPQCRRAAVLWRRSGMPSVRRGRHACGGGEGLGQCDRGPDADVLHCIHVRGTHQPASRSLTTTSLKEGALGPPEASGRGW